MTISQNTYDEFVLFMEDEVERGSLQKVTKEKIREKLEEESKQKSGFFGIGSKNAQDLSKETTLNTLLQNVIGIDMLGDDSYKTPNELWNAFKENQKDKIQKFYDYQANTWINQLQKKIDERDEAKHFTPAWYNCTTLIARFTEQLKNIGFEWLKTLLSLRIVIRFSQSHAWWYDEDDTYDVISTMDDIEEIQQTMFMKDRFWSLYTWLDKWNKEWKGYITKVETYTTAFIDGFQEYIKNEIIPWFEKALLLLEEESKYDRNHPDLTHSSKTVQEEYNTLYKKYQLKKEMFDNEINVIRQKQVLYTKIFDWLTHLRDARKKQDQYFIETNAVLEKTYDILLIDEISDNDLPKIIELNRLLRNRLDTMPLWSNICWEIIESDTDNSMIASDKQKIEYLYQTAQNKEEWRKMMMENIIQQLEEKRKSAPWFKSLYTRCFDYINENKQLMTKYFDKDSSQSITKTDEQQVRSAIERLLNEYEILESKYNMLNSQKEDIDITTWEIIVRNYDITTQAVNLYRLPRENFKKKREQKIDLFADNQMLLHASLHAQIKTAEHVLRLTVLFMHWNVLFNQWPLKVLRYNDKNYLHIHGYLALLSDEELVTKRLDRVEVSDEFGNTQFVDDIVGKQLILMDAKNILDQKNNTVDTTFSPHQVYIQMRLWKKKSLEYIIDTLKNDLSLDVSVIFNELQQSDISVKDLIHYIINHQQRNEYLSALLWDRYDDPISWIPFLLKEWIWVENIVALLKDDTRTYEQIVEVLINNNVPREKIEKALFDILSVDDLLQILILCTGSTLQIFDFIKRHEVKLSYWIEQILNCYDSSAWKEFMFSKIIFTFISQWLLDDVLRIQIIRWCYNAKMECDSIIECLQDWGFDIVDIAKYIRVLECMTYMEFWHLIWGFCNSDWYKLGKSLKNAWISRKEADSILYGTWWIWLMEWNSYLNSNYLK